MQIALTGPRGLLGTRIIKLLKADFNFIPLGHADFDVSNEEMVTTKLGSLEYDLLLHLAAYTNVDGAEKEKEKAHDINVNGTANVFRAVKKQNKKMIYLSTDFVFDGRNPPFDEKSIPNPIGYYATSKYEGEKVLNNQAMIVRISYPYGNPQSPKPDFVSRITSMLQSGKELKMVTDSLMTPTHIDDIAYGLKYLIANWKPEIFHLVGPKSYSPFAVGQMIAEKNNISKDLIQPTTFAEYIKDKAPRPQYSNIISQKNDFWEMRVFGET